MYAVRHALANLYKNIGRSLLFGAVIFAVVAAASTALTVYNASALLIGETKTALMCAVRIAPKMRVSGAAGGQRQPNALTPEQYMYFAESIYLDGADLDGGASGADAVYYLKDPGMLAAFEAELTAKGMPDDYAVRTDESAFERIAGPVESLNRLSMTYLALTLALGALIIALLSAIAVRERKYEIGVLRAIGMKKAKVTLVLWTELVAVTCVCFIFGFAAGSALSQPAADAMMAGQGRAASPGSTTLYDRLNETDSKRIKNVDVTAGAVTVLEMFGVSLLLASVAGAVTTGRITRYEPIKILSERE